jgi:hypothetical protein
MSIQSYSFNENKGSVSGNYISREKTTNHHINV